MGSGRATALRGEKLSKMYKVYTRPIDILLELLTTRPRHVERLASRQPVLDA